MADNLCLCLNCLNVHYHISWVIYTISGALLWYINYGWGSVGLLNLTPVSVSLTCFTKHLYLGCLESLNYRFYGTFNQLWYSELLFLVTELDVNKAIYLINIRHQHVYILLCIIFLQFRYSLHNHRKFIVLFSPESELNILLVKLYACISAPVKNWIFCL